MVIAVTRHTEQWLWIDEGKARRKCEQRDVEAGKQSEARKVRSTATAQLFSSTLYRLLTSTSSSAYIESPIHPVFNNVLIPLATTIPVNYPTGRQHGLPSVSS